MDNGYFIFPILFIVLQLAQWAETEVLSSTEVLLFAQEREKKALCVDSHPSWAFIALLRKKQQGGI